MSRQIQSLAGNCIFPNVLILDSVMFCVSDGLHLIFDLISVLSWHLNCFSCLQGVCLLTCAPDDESPILIYLKTGS